MSGFGVPLGLALLALVTLVAVAIARRAAKSVMEFREEHHERFRGREEE